jgi:hypothetical protein
MRVQARGLLAVLLVLGLAAPALAQGGGASQTGVISGRVTDTSGAVLPGVTVTISSPSLMGVQNTVTNESGLYRFPAVPPGVYAITYEVPGFSTLKREGIDIALGFQATVNVELRVASVTETVTVTGASPVIDTSQTRVQQNFKLEALNSMPNARDMWALLAVTPGVSMTRIDVGGNRAGTQTGYTAYGFGGQDQQVRVLVEGINTTEGTGGAGFYFDYGSFEEVYIGTTAQGAEMPHPGVQSQFLGKSGGNRFQGAIYQDYENNSLQGSNLPDSYTAPTAFNNNPIRPGSNEIERYRDFNINVGGPIKKDKVWWYFSYRNQFNAVQQVNFRFDKTFDTTLWNPSGKVTYQASQNNKFIGYYQWGQKVQPYRLWNGSYVFNTPDDTQRQDSGSWVWKGEWNGTLSNKLYVEARYGDFGYYFPLLGYSDQPFRQDQGLRTSEGGDRQWQQDRDRKQLTGAATYFKDNFLGGSHNIKFGGETDLETQWNGFQRIRAENIEHIFNNGAPFRVILGFPTASGSLGSKGDRGNLLSIGKLNQISAFLSDQWSIGRVTLNLGVRYDHYKSFYPDQQQLAGSNGPITLPALTTIPGATLFTWDSVVPRVGFAYDVGNDGRTVIKMNYGYFKHNPGPGIAADGGANPNQAEKTITYTWNDLNGNRHYDLGEEGTVVTSRLAGAIQIDPNITQPYTHEFGGFVERQLTADFGARVGFVYKTNDNLWQQYQPFRPISGYTTPFNVIDPGVDGRAGTTDDRTLTFLATPNSQLGPATLVIQNVPAIGRYKTIEGSVNRRLRDRWSFGAGFGYTWTREHNGSATPNLAIRGNTITPSLYPNSPNDTSLNDSTGWGFKAFGTYDAPWDIRISPIYRNQSGQNYGRTLSVNAPASCACFFSGTILVEPFDARRMDNINIFDVRAEKAVRVGGPARVKLFSDVFNITNSHASEIISFQAGLGFERPANVVAPRVLRLGFKFEW